MKKLILFFFLCLLTYSCASKKSLTQGDTKDTNPSKTKLNNPIGIEKEALIEPVLNTGADTILFRPRL